MAPNFDRALQAVLRHEGGFVNHPSDPGGMTNLGCTRRTWEEWVGHPVDEATMRSLKPSDVAPLYKARYWDKVRGDDLPAGVDYAVFDAAINSGPVRAAQWLQQLVGAKPDGVIGPITLRAVLEQVPFNLTQQFNAHRLEFLQSLDNWGTFGKGWSRRLLDVAGQSAAMATQPPLPAPIT